MGWLGKVIGGGIGGALGGPIGIGVGLGLGHFFDNKLDANEEETSYGNGYTPMEEFEIRLIEKDFGEDGQANRGLIIEGRGLAPIDYATEITFITSILDITGGEDDTQPVLSTIDDFQEPETAAYHFKKEAGGAEPGQGYDEWTELGYVFFDLLIPPEGGWRNLEILLRVIDSNSPPDIHLGYGPTFDKGTFYTFIKETRFNFPAKGWLEEVIGRDESRGLAVRLAIAVAMSDGSFDQTEGNVIKKWILRTISSYEDDRQQQIKELCNTAMREAHEDARNESLSTKKTASRLNEVAPDAQKYEAMELCYEVMAADGKADEAEMKILRKIADNLDLDYKEIEKIRDRAMLGLNPQMQSQANIEEIVGIDSSWPKNRIQKHIRTEFAKWNGRLASLPVGQERSNAQRMLNLLAEVRKKYG
jgi:tellurite resistance protein